MPLVQVGNLYNEPIANYPEANEKTSIAFKALRL